MTFFAPILYIISVLLPGRVLMRCFDSKDTLLRWAGAYGLGTALVTGELFLYFLILRLSFSPALYIFMGLQAVIAAFVLYKKSGFAMKIKIVRWSVVEIVLAAVIGGCLALAALNAFTKPPVGFDSLTFWSLRTKVLIQQGSVDFHRDHQFYLGAYNHRAYPWHSSLAEYWMRILGGGEVSVNLIPLGYYIAIAIALFSALRSFLARRESLLLVAFFVSMPLIFYHGYNGYSDLVLAYYVVMSAVYLMRKELSSDNIALSALFIGWGFFVKNEGIIYVLAWIGAMAVSTGIRRSRFSVREWMRMSAFLLLPLLPWILFRSFLGLSLHDLPPARGWHPEVIKPFITSLFVDDNWHIWGWIFAVTIALRGWKLWRNKNVWPLIILFALSLGMILGMYMTSENYVYALDHTALSRTLIPVIALSILAAGYCFEYSEKNISENV